MAQGEDSNLNEPHMLLEKLGTLLRVEGGWGDAWCARWHPLSFCLLPACCPESPASLQQPLVRPLCTVSPPFCIPCVSICPQPPPHRHVWRPTPWQRALRPPLLPHLLPVTCSAEGAHNLPGGAVQGGGHGREWGLKIKNIFALHSAAVIAWLNPEPYIPRLPVSHVTSHVPRPTSAM